MDDQYREFKIWIVMYSLDMLMSQHQIDFNEASEAVFRLRELRESKPLAPLQQPEFDIRLIRGHTPVCRKEDV